MDFLFSVPFFYYFLSGPTIWSSLSTTLNFLFFYMTWSTLVLTNHPWQIHLAGVLVIRLVIFLVPSLLTLSFDLLLPSLARIIKHGGERSLPPRDAKKVALVVLRAVFGVLLVTAAEGLGAGAYARVFRGQYPFRASIILPAPFVIFKHVAWMYVIRGLAQYFIHRDVLHSPRESLHGRLHAQTSHGGFPLPGAAPLSILAYGDHPLPLLLHRFLPLFGAGIVIQPHMTTYFLFVFLCTLEETLSMSGYSAVPGFVMSGMTRRAAEHYMHGGGGNFGTLGLMDWLLDTGIGRRDVVDDVRDEMETHHVKQRATKKIESGLGRARDAVDGELERRTTRRSARSRS